MKQETKKPNAQNTTLCFCASIKSMDKHRICKICNRRFANGKAMGGHMRSHFAKHPISSSNINPSPPKYPSSSSSLSNMQTYRSVNNRPFSGLEDESEAESSRNLTKARSKRPLRTIESVSNSVTENFLSDREVAMCLLKLSRDNWLQKDKQVVVAEAVVDEDEYVRGKSDDGDNDEEEDKEEDESSLVSRTNKYKCKTCKKEFRSYQALGGHKASHKKIKIHHNGSSDAAAAGDAVVMDQRVFKCPFCDKVFDSGQALGGHKKIHFTYLATPITKITSSAKSSGAKFIDLNLPAPEDDSEVSQV